MAQQTQEQKVPSFPPVVRSLIRETAERRLSEFRDTVDGRIDDKRLAKAVLTDIESDHPDIAATGRQEAWAVGVYLHVREFIRLSTSEYARHDRTNRNAKAKATKTARSRQRRYVTFRDHTGNSVTKDRVYLRMDELPLVRRAYEARRAGDEDVIAWCDATWEQMRLLGLMDHSLVKEVVSEVKNDDDKQVAV